MSENDLKALQRKTKQVSDRYASLFGIERDDVWYIGKLNEELGELTQAFLNYSGRGKQEPSSSQARTAMEDEAADLLGSLLMFADWQNIDLEAAIERKWFKYLNANQRE